MFIRAYKMLICILKQLYLFTFYLKYVIIKRKRLYIYLQASKTTFQREDKPKEGQKK